MEQGITPGQRALEALRAFRLAVGRGDERLKAAALSDYREALRDLRAEREEEVEKQLANLDRMRAQYRADWS